MLALREGLRPGLSERDLADLVERSYVALGGVNAIHFIGVTPMAAPRLGVPAQFAGNRKVARGDVVVAEIAPRSGSTPARCCAASRSMPSRRRSIATCMRPPMRHSMRSPRAQRRRYAAHR